MKKITAFMIAAVFILGSIIALAGCGKVMDEKEITVTTANQGENVHVFYYTYDDNYISSLKTELDKAFKDAGINCRSYDGGADQATQTNQIKAAVENGAKAIVVDIVDTASDKAANDIVTMAKNAGIPVIFFNREVSDNVVRSYNKCAFVGTDSEGAGHIQGQMIGEYLLGNYDAYDLNKDGKISYIMLKGEDGNMEAVYRTKYSVEDADGILAAAGKAALSFFDPNNKDKYLVDKEGKWSSGSAKEYVTAALKTNNETSKNMIELIICNNDAMAEGAIEALNEAGYNTGKTGSRTIPVFGVDATDNAKTLITAGKMAGTVKQDAEGTAKAITHITKNALDSTKDLMDDTGSYKIDNAVNKIRIACDKLMGK